MSQLKKIIGVVENLRIEKGYQDLVLRKADTQSAGAAAVGGRPWAKSPVRRF